MCEAGHCITVSECPCLSKDLVELNSSRADSKMHATRQELSDFIADCKAGKFDLWTIS